MQLKNISWWICFQKGFVVSFKCFFDFIYILYYISIYVFYTRSLSYFFRLNFRFNPENFSLFNFAAFISLQYFLSLNLHTLFCSAVMCWSINCSLNFNNVCSILSFCYGSFFQFCVLFALIFLRLLMSSVSMSSVTFCNTCLL